MIDEPRVRVPDIDLGIRDETVARGDHVAYLWEDEEEFSEAVDFLLVGLERGDHCVVFGHDDANEHVLGILRRAGYDPEELVEAGQLSIVGGKEDAEEILASLAEKFEAALEEGAELIRVLGNIGWEREGWPATRDLLEFEARVTEAARSFPSVILCMFDVRALSGTVLLHGAFETHPFTVCGNLLRENPLHMPIEDFLPRISDVD